jgi:hypothetical protein
LEWVRDKLWKIFLSAPPPAHRKSIFGSISKRYVPIIEQVRAFLGTCDQATITVNVSLAYFNSSSTKMLFSLFDLLNQAALAGNHVRLNWYHHEDDDTILEFGEELHADFAALDFYDRPLSNT